VTQDTLEILDHLATLESRVQLDNVVIRVQLVRLVLLVKPALLDHRETQEHLLHRVHRV
jgi:hypothetical protein